MPARFARLETYRRAVDPPPLDGDSFFELAVFLGRAEGPQAEAMKDHVASRTDRRIEAEAYRARIEARRTFLGLDDNSAVNRATRTLAERQLTERYAVTSGPERAAVVGQAAEEPAVMAVAQGVLRRSGLTRKADQDAVLKNAATAVATMLLADTVAETLAPYGRSRTTAANIGDEQQALTASLGAEMALYEHVRSAGGALDRGASPGLASL